MLPVMPRQNLNLTYHLLAKRKLFNWFTSYGYDAVLEGYIPTIKKRADILVRVDEKKYALNFNAQPLARQSLLNEQRPIKALILYRFGYCSAKILKG